MDRERQDKEQAKTHLGRWVGQSRGWGPWQADWMSFCSAHREARADCAACMAGEYRNRLAGQAERLVAKHAYWLWHWWVNRPGSRTRKRLEEAFPNLRG